LIHPIQSAEALAHWHRVDKYISDAVCSVDTGYSSEDILTRIQMREMQLWVVGDYVAAAVTQIQKHPGHTTLLVVALGGSGLTDWFDELMDDLEGYARDIGCKYIEEFGRDGWEKVSKHRGYKKVYVVMRKEL